MKKQIAEFMSNVLAKQAMKGVKKEKAVIGAPQIPSELLKK